MVLFWLGHTITCLPILFFHPVLIATKIPIIRRNILSVIGILFGDWICIADFVWLSELTVIFCYGVILLIFLVIDTISTIFLIVKHIIFLFDLIHPLIRPFLHLLPILHEARRDRLFALFWVITYCILGYLLETVLPLHFNNKNIINFLSMLTNTPYFYLWTQRYHRHRQSHIFLIIFIIALILKKY
jgi:hypothetical protein